MNHHRRTQTQHFQQQKETQVQPHPEVSRPATLHSLPIPSHTRGQSPSHHHVPALPIHKALQNQTSATSFSHNSRPISPAYAAPSIARGGGSSSLSNVASNLVPNARAYTPVQKAGGNRQATPTPPNVTSILQVGSEVAHASGGGRGKGNQSPASLRTHMLAHVWHKIQTLMSIDLRCGCLKVELSAWYDRCLKQMYKSKNNWCQA